MNINSENLGYCTITYKYRINSNYTKFLVYTKTIYNQIILKYYNLLFEHQEFLNLSNQYCLRELEKLTIKSRSGVIPNDYIDIDMPVYFRRSAINQAIGSFRKYLALYKNYMSKEIRIGNEPSLCTAFNVSPIFYKGMYKEFTDNSVMLKLWNGDSWNWYKIKFKGKKIKDLDSVLSPTVVINSDFAMLHVPVREVVEDVRPVKARMQDDDLKVMGISFSNQDNFAVCTILDKNRNFIKSKFISGGNEYKNSTSKILNLIKKHRQASKTIQEKDHKRYWEKLNNINNSTAHKASKEIVDFAKANNVRVISITKVTEDVSSFVHKVGRYSPIYLRRKIISDLEYKSFKNGILITTVRQNYTASKCYKCRADVKKKNDLYVCSNGHTGNYYFNTAMNIAIMSLKKFGK